MAPTKDAQKLRRLAERKGEAKYQFQLACLFYTGKKGLKQDLVAAAKWWRKAAAQEHVGAQHNIGMCYAEGEGVEQNHALAATWLKKAADQGHVRQISRVPQQPLRRWQGRGAGRHAGGGVVGESRGEG
jgi:TPR repeat protein